MEDFFPKQMRPGGFQQGQALRAEMLKRMEHVELFVVFDVDHGNPG